MAAQIPRQHTNPDLPSQLIMYLRDHTYADQLAEERRQILAIAAGTAIRVTEED